MILQQTEARNPTAVLSTLYGHKCKKTTIKLHYIYIVVDLKTKLHQKLCYTRDKNFFSFFGIFWLITQEVLDRNAISLHLLKEQLSGYPVSVVLLLSL